MISFIIFNMVFTACPQDPENEKEKETETENIITIGDNGNWFIDGKDTGLRAPSDSEKYYLLIFRSNGGLFDDGTDLYLLITDGIDITPPNVTYDLHIFDGWYSESDKGTIINLASVEKCMVLYAHWIYESYTVCFDVNGADSGDIPSPIVQIYGTSVLLPNEGNLVKTGFIFYGWNTEADGNGIFYNIGDIYDDYSDIIFYAFWFVETDPVATFQKDAAGKWLNELPSEAPGEYEIIPDFNHLTGELGGYRIDINPGTKYQVMNGFGASDAWITNYLMGGGEWAPDIDTVPGDAGYRTWGQGLNEQSKQKIADWLFSQDFDEKGEVKGIGLSQWRVNLGAGSWEQGEKARIGVGAIANFTNSNSNWQNRAESLLYDIGDPTGNKTETQSAINGSSIVKHPVSGIVYNWNKMKGQQYLMGEAKKRGTENFILFCNSVPIPWTLNGFANSGNKDAFLSGGNWVPADRVTNIDFNNINGNGQGDVYFGHYLADAAEYFTNKGYKIQFVSPFNEPQYQWNENKQEGSPGFNTDMARIVKEIDKQVQARPTISGSNGVKVMLSEAARWDHLYQGSTGFGDQIRAFFDSGSSSYIGNLVSMQPYIIAGHTYFSHNNDTDTYTYRNNVRAMANQYYALGQGIGSGSLLNWNAGGTQVYSTEWCAMTGGGGFPNPDTHYRNALFNAKLTYQDITIAGAVSYAYWTAISKDVGFARYGLLSHFPGVNQYQANANSLYSFFDENGFTKTQAPLWGTGHYSLFVRPGFRRIALSGNGIDTNAYMGLMGTAYVSPTGYQEFNPATGKYDGEAIDRVVTVYVNMGTSARRIVADINGDFGDGRIYGGSGGKWPRMIRVYMTDFNNIESSSPSLMIYEGLFDENGNVPGVPASVRNNKEGPASGYGMRRQLHDNGLIYIPKESIVTVVYDF